MEVQCYILAKAALLNSSFCFLRGEVQPDNTIGSSELMRSRPKSCRTSELMRSRFKPCRTTDCLKFDNGKFEEFPLLSSERTKSPSPANLDNHWERIWGANASRGENAGYLGLQGCARGSDGNISMAHISYKLYIT